MLPNAREQYDILKKEINLQFRQNRFRPTSKIKQMEAAQASFGRIISSPPAQFPDKGEYLKKVQDNLEREFDDSITTLVTKCRKFELDTDQVQIHHPRMSERGFDVLLSDNRNRVLDARMIWAAENSEYVSMHTRYIVTERSMGADLRQTEKERPSSPTREYTNINIYTDPSGTIKIRCKADGFQLLGEKLSPEDTRIYNDALDAGDKQVQDKLLKELAAKYFTGQLDNDRKTTMKR